MRPADCSFLGAPDGAPQGWWVGSGEAWTRGAPQASRPSATWNSAISTPRFSSCVGTVRHPRSREWRSGTWIAGGPSSGRTPGAAGGLPACGKTRRRKPAAIPRRPSGWTCFEVVRRAPEFAGEVASGRFEARIRRVRRKSMLEAGTLSPAGEQCCCDRDRQTENERPDGRGDGEQQKGKQGFGGGQP